MKLKTGALFALLLLLSLLGSCFAQERKQTAPASKYEGHSTKFAVMVTDVQHFRASILTANEMNVKGNQYSFVIVVAGELAKDIAEDPSLLDDIAACEKIGAKIVVCENALSYFNIPLEKLDKRLYTTKNSWIYMFQLKDKGYNTLNV
ncbi:hypothetical protein [Sphingobacterium athyrii]|nr:hypothetical protein [Sphingobacterium athyrii]